VRCDLTLAAREGGHWHLTVPVFLALLCVTLVDNIPSRSTWGSSTINKRTWTSPGSGGTGRLRSLPSYSPGLSSVFVRLPGRSRAHHARVSVRSRTRSDGVLVTAPQICSLDASGRAPAPDPARRVGVNGDPNTGVRRLLERDLHAVQNGRNKFKSDGSNSLTYCTGHVWRCAANLARCRAPVQRAQLQARGAYSTCAGVLAVVSAMLPH
jgi:hypothetical protein